MISRFLLLLLCACSFVFTIYGDSADQNTILNDTQANKPNDKSREDNAVKLSSDESDSSYNEQLNSAIESIREQMYAVAAREPRRCVVNSGCLKCNGDKSDVKQCLSTGSVQENICIVPPSIFTKYEMKRKACTGENCTPTINLDFDGGDDKGTILLQTSRLYFQCVPENNGYSAIALFEFAMVIVAVGSLVYVFKRRRYDRLSTIPR